jgi:dipeptidyl-peptidase-4
MSGEDSFPWRSAVTRRFTLGRPRSFSVAGDGARVVFLRSPAGDDPSNALWVFDVAEAEERLVVDPRELREGDEDLPAAERARRERAREQAGGIVAYAADLGARVAAFALAGRLLVADLVRSEVRELAVRGPVFDPRPDPTGRRVAFVSERALRVADVATGADREAAGEDDHDVTWGLAEFVAAEEMDRTRGFWWSPDGGSILAARVDTGPVQRWHIANPAEPASSPQEVAYPAAGTANAAVSLALFDMEGSRRDVTWDSDAFPYLVRVSWEAGHPLTLLTQSRDQRRMAVLTVDPTTGGTTTVDELHDDAWVEIVGGVPAWLSDGRLVTVRDDLEADRRRLWFDGVPVTPVEIQVRDVVALDDGVLFTASTDPTEVHVWRADPDGTLLRLTSEPGVHGAVAGGGTRVIVSASLDRAGSEATVLRGEERIGGLRSFAETPTVRPVVTFGGAGERGIRTALLLPSGGGTGPYPVLMDPYGGPGYQRVLKARDAFLQSQWLADQGFAVVVADGRGTPGRGVAWEKAVHLDLAGPALEDQVDALRGVAEANPGLLDLDRVAIRGWSFGGYLAALAVLRRPDVFHAGIAGAPVTDWRLYDTHYTERYLGLPLEHPEAYERSSALAHAALLRRPLLIVHGMADDNVVAAHSLRLSRALLEAGRPHTFLPLSGVTHMTPQEVVAENLLRVQVAFLRDALGLEPNGV